MTSCNTRSSPTPSPRGPAARGMQTSGVSTISHTCGLLFFVVDGVRRAAHGKPRTRLGALEPGLKLPALRRTRTRLCRTGGRPCRGSYVVTGNSGIGGTSKFRQAREKSPNAACANARLFRASLDSSAITTARSRVDGVYAPRRYRGVTLEPRSSQMPRLDRASMPAHAQRLASATFPKGLPQRSEYWRRRQTPARGAPRAWRRSSPVERNPNLSRFSPLHQNAAARRVGSRGEGLRPDGRRRGREYSVAGARATTPMLFRCRLKSRSEQRTADSDWEFRTRQ